MHRINAHILAPAKAGESKSTHGQCCHAKSTAGVLVSTFAGGQTAKLSDVRGEASDDHVSLKPSLGRYRSVRACQCDAVLKEDGSLNEFLLSAVPFSPIEGRLCFRIAE